MDHYGELVPLGGGDPIPLLRGTLTIGRRESCDVVLRFANVSGIHCRLTLETGYWFVQDLHSQNGTKVNGSHVMRKRLDPGDTLSIARHKYKIEYSPTDLGATGAPPSEEEDITAVLGKSLLDRAGLQRREIVRRIDEPLDDDQLDKRVEIEEPKPTEGS